MMKTFEFMKPDVMKMIHGLPTDGQKIKFTKPSEWGFFTSMIKDQELLELDKEYTVRKTQLNSSSTYVWLEEIECYDTERDLPFYNLGSFEWVLPEIDVTLLISLNVRECLHLHYFHKMGIKFDGKIFYEGSPMLVLEYDPSNGNVTKAYYE